ncbi:MAG: glycine--tRNA ligase subunit beta [Hyphomonadaceae bacterium]|nr:glycine--tRNA ligase subunit beta [Hyphomonadaceae bacterium]
MPQLLLEILSEEIPARMQAKAEADLVKALMDGLTTAGLIPEGIKGFSGPRRLVAVVEGLPVKSADVTEDVIGPKEGAPQPAIDGFLRKAGLASLSDAHLHEVPKKGRVYVAHVRKPGKQTADVIAALVPQIIRGFHWPKSMRWGTGDLRWVRPISRILCTFDGEVVPFEIEGIKSDAYTEGHRIMGRGPYKVRRFDDYEDVLKNKGRVILDREERKETILTEAKQLCGAQNLELVDDIGLLEEVAGLAEFPVVIIGDMDKAFLDLPPEVIKLSMRTHQKYFAVRDPAKGDGSLAPKFIVVANLDAADGGKKIAEGNSRVLSARLNDARFFWDNDRYYDATDKGKRTHRPLHAKERIDALNQLVFHSNPRLGSVGARAKRLERIATRMSDLLGYDSAIRAKALSAALLSKCDLVTDMVGEFPELEGLMGSYYAAEDWPPEVAAAIRDQYRPKGPGDFVPTAPVSIALALADKLEMLSGFWIIGEKPTGSKDPYALRRSALGVVRIILENNLRLSLLQAFLVPFALIKTHLVIGEAEARQEQIRGLLAEGKISRKQAEMLAKENAATTEDAHEQAFSSEQGVAAFDIAINLLSFFADRLKVHLREQGARHDLIDAVFALGEDDLVLIVKRVEALGEFLATEDGRNLLAGYKRAANILAIEEKKDGKSYSGQGKAMDGDPSEVDALVSALTKAAPEADAALGTEDFAGAMRALSKLRGPVDAFFDKVTVNADDAAARANRLTILSQIRDALGRVADFSKIEG